MYHFIFVFNLKIKQKFKILDKIKFKYFLIFFIKKLFYFNFYNFYLVVRKYILLININYYKKTYHKICLH